MVDSLRRSRELVRGNGWQVFGTIVVFVLVFIVIGAAFSAIGGAAGAVLRVLANILTAPFIALASSVLYFELLGARGETMGAGAAAPAVGSGEGRPNPFGEGVAPQPPAAQPGTPDPPYPPTPGG